MSKLNFIIALCFLAILEKNCKAGDINDSKPFVLTDIGTSVKFISMQSFNKVLEQQGLPPLGNIAYTGHFGIRFGEKNWMVNANLETLRANEKENGKISTLSAWGLSAGYGYKLWEKGRMCLYPYIQASYLLPRFNSQEQSGATTFAVVYEQPLTERTFQNTGEIDLALGLTYQIEIGEKCVLGLHGGYNFRLFQGKWEYAGKKVDFPSADLRGWEAGISIGL